ncbi:MAG: calcium/sodium antiporter [bacterium]
MLIDFVIFIGGIALVIKGADYLVDGASDIAKRLKVSSLVIGLTVVAFGTSAPELAVNIFSAIGGHTEIALGNVNGSNIANILLILGAAGMVATIPIQSRTVIKEVPFMILSGVVLVLLMLDTVLEGAPAGMISRIDGLVLIAFFSIFIYYLFLSSKDVSGAKVEKAKRSFLAATGLSIFGIGGLLIGGQLTVSGASGLALGFGVSETLIAVTIVALGTSLPELVTAVVAARKGETDIAVGNIIGSVVFNILLILGATAVITPIAVLSVNIVDALVSLGAMLLLLAAIFIRSDSRDGMRSIYKTESVIFLILYAAYIVYAVMRG